FTRAIWNLLDNAVKYSAGTVAIEVKALLKNGKVRISIADHGVGFPAEEQSRIFSKFVRGSAAALTNAKGTGLGLAMVQRIIEDQGGAISARSSQGEGSVFTITLESTKPQ
ncbi:MAG: ATP-binding protein, partial [Proteobacteria bacterium]|nr:ATP-binding protein [Pseudomonadota bacterium]